MKMENLSEIPEEIKEYLAMAADGDVETLASATWWALINGKETLGLQWFNENWKSVQEVNSESESDDSDWTQSRNANVLSNVCFLRLATDPEDTGLLTSLEELSQYSVEARFAPALIAHRDGEKDQCDNLLAKLSQEEISNLKRIYEGVIETDEESGASNSWFVNWSREALTLLPNFSFDINSNMQMRPVRGIYLGGATVYFADALGGETGTLIQDKIEVFLGYDCAAVVASLELDSEPVGLVVFPFGPMFEFSAPEPLHTVATYLQNCLLEATEPIPRLPSVQFVPEHLMQFDGFEIGTLSNPSKIFVSGVMGESEIGSDSDSDVVIDCQGEMKVFNFTEEMVGGTVLVLRSDLIKTSTKAF
jgi:hypothetical protein